MNLTTPKIPKKIIFYDFIHITHLPIITPILTGSHWLPVRFRIILKILFLTYKAINTYWDMKTRFANWDLQTTTCFTSLWPFKKHMAIAGPKLWNKLPSNIRQPSSVDVKTKFKTYLFKNELDLQLLFETWTVLNILFYPVIFISMVKCHRQLMHDCDSAALCNWNLIFNLIKGSTNQALRVALSTDKRACSRTLSTAVWRSISLVNTEKDYSHKISTFI